MGYVTHLIMIVTYGLCYTPKKEWYDTYISSLNTFLKAFVLVVEHRER